MPWHWNSANEESISIRKIFKTFSKNNIFHKRYGKKCFKSVRYSCATRCKLQKVKQLEIMKWRFLGHPRIWWLKVFEIMNWNSHYDSWFIPNSGISIQTCSLINSNWFFATSVASFYVSLPLCTTEIKIITSTSSVKGKNFR